MIQLAGDVLHTRLAFNKARLVRRPYYFRGKHWMKFGAGLTTGRGLRIDALDLIPGCTPSLIVGRDVQINDYVHLAVVSSLTVGDRVLIASKVFITDHQHGSYKENQQHSSPLLAPAQRALSHAPVTIGDDVWIGESVSILPGVTIGNGAIVGTHATVTRDVPAYSIVAGSPARVIKRFNFDTARWESA
jgi:lipopolysaccharide O-acetyltransferase